MKGAPGTYSTGETHWLPQFLRLAQRVWIDRLLNQAGGFVNFQAFRIEKMNCVITLLLRGAGLVSLPQDCECVEKRPDTAEGKGLNLTTIPVGDTL